MVVPFYIILIRLIVPFSILRWSLFGILLSTLVDMYDWKFVHVASDTDLAFYQYLDKGFDFYYLLFALIVAFRWKDILAKNIAIFLFIFRLFGLGIFLFWKERPALFYFPNVFENFFIFYVAFTHFSKKQILLTSKRLTTTILLSLIIPKLIHEYFMHYLGKQPWEIYDVGMWFGFSGILQEYINYFAWGTLFYITPFLIFIWLLRK